MKNNEDQEKEIRRRLKKETDKALKVETATWEKIQQELFAEEPKKGVWMKRVGAIIGTVAVATILFVMFSSGTFTNEVAEEPNNPEIPDNVTGNEPEELLADLYEKEKQMEIELEGMKEPVDMVLAVNEEERYILYIEKERYQFRQSDEESVVNLTNELDENYPPVAMVIKKQTNTTMEEQIQFVKNELEKDGMIMFLEQEVNEPIDGYTIKAFAVEEDKWQWDTGVHRYYITEVESGTFFIFKLMFFYEAVEGHAMRFEFMLKNFEYVGEGTPHN